MGKIERYIIRALATLALPCSSILAVGGISNTKLIVPGADPVGYGAFEFEPTLGMSRQRYRFDQYSNRTDIPDDYNRLLPLEEKMSFSTNSLGFRMTGGLFPNTEIGVFVGHSTASDSVGTPMQTGFDEAQIGIKYLFNPENAMRFAFEGGVNFDPTSWSPSYEGGLIMTLELTNRFSIDADLVASTSSIIREDRERFTQRGAAGNIGFGYMIGNLQPVVEFGYAETNSLRYRYPRISQEYFYLTDLGIPEQYDVNPILGLPSTVMVPGIPVPVPVLPVQEQVRVWSRKLTTSVGFTYTVNSKATIIFTMSEDLDGMNDYGGRTAALALTFTFEDEEGEQSAEEVKARPSPSGRIRDAL
jgi:hypothetical protein